MSHGDAEPPDPGGHLQFHEFESLMRRLKIARPIWFELEQGPVSSLGEVHAFESRVGADLPDQYKRFLLEFGHGHFGFLKILGLTDIAELDSNLPSQQLPTGFLPVADLETGDYFGYEPNGNGEFGSAVVAWDHELSSYTGVRYPDFFTLVASVAFKGFDPG